MLENLCVYGDSVSKGVVLDSVRNRYTFFKDCFANAFAAATGVAVDNFSRFGCTIDRGLDIIAKHKDTFKNYDYIVLEFGGNGCNYNWAEIADAPDAEHSPVTPIPKFEDTYLRILEDIRSNGGRPVMFNLPPIDAVKFFNWVSKGLNSDNILKWLGDVEHIFRWHASYNDAVCRIAKETKTPLVDIRSDFLKSPNYRELICEDGMHPNGSGHQLISEILSRYTSSLAAKAII